MLLGEADKVQSSRFGPFNPMPLQTVQHESISLPKNARLNACVYKHDMMKNDANARERTGCSRR